MTKDGTALTTDSVQLISSMFALLPVPVAVVDDRGRVVLSNSCFTDIFPRTPNISTLLQHEVEVPGRGTFEVQTVPLNDQGFRIVFATDVSNEAQLRRQVTHLEKMAAIGRVVRGVAHELSNPLADIASYAPLVARCNLDPAAREIVGVVFTRAERAGHLVQNLLALAGITAPKHAAFDLNGIVQNIVDLRGRRKHTQNFDVSLELDASLPKAAGDPSQIEQVVIALLINAEDAVSGMQRRPGSIRIQTSTGAGRIQLHVADNGVARDAARMFEPHETGVGLSICAEIVKDHGGELYAWSAYGNGSTLTLELPVYIQDPSDTTTAAGRCLRGKTVMVVDDEVHITALIYDVLTRHGATVHVANSGSDAYERLRTTNYDLIMCDQRMPGLSGQSLYRLVESLNPAIKHKFLFITGDVVTVQMRQFFSHEGLQFLRKPFRMQDLLETIEGLFNRTPIQGF